MNRVYILLGANLGDPKAQLARAVEEIGAHIAPIVAQSSLVRSAAWGLTDQPDFINQVIELHTNLKAIDILDQMQAIEDKLGRVRLEKWGARVIDIDMLYFNDEILDTKRLQIPHPYLHERRFTLAPLAEIAPDFIHPILGLSSTALLQNCSDKLPVTFIK